jgi:hypothetical protein
MSARRRAALLLAALALAGCTAEGPQPTSATAPSTSAPITPAPVTRAPSARAGIASPRGLPPDAGLRVDGGDPVAGQLGSFSDADGGSDSPWLPGSPVTAVAGQPIRVELADGSAIAGWTARRAPAGSADGAGATPLAEGVSDVAFRAPGPGSWTVEVTIRFAAGGSATYYWRLDVT